MTDHELSTMLRDLADSPAPPPAIDVERARRRGGRRRRLRSAAVVVGCAAVVAAGGVTAVSVSREDVKPALAPVAVAPQPPAAVPVDNPLVAKASFGWLPEQIKGVEYGAGGHGDYALAIGRGQLAPMIWLSVSDREPPTPRDLGGTPKQIPQKVGNRDGYWLTTDANDPLNHGDVYLRWSTGDGRWVQLHAYYLAVPDLQQVLTRVAGEVTVATKAVPLPLHVTSLPPSFHPAEASLWRRPDTDGVPWRAVLQYSSNGALATITVSLPGGQADGLGEPKCVTKNGLQACVAIDQPAAAGITSQELLSRITLLGPDEAKWTPHVIG
ncbi:hypothetical protein ABJI51_04745 [Amycolatopsis sp. NEAU-NG30]|uniref:Uncharacterized protein n=1 Tax=Amycolatopsis melonis TaxID=3156488 RepID=A0ABV0L8S2_9PSEU